MLHIHDTELLRGKKIDRRHYLCLYSITLAVSLSLVLIILPLSLVMSFVYVFLVNSIVGAHLLSQHGFCIIYSICSHKQREGIGKHTPVRYSVTKKQKPECTYRYINCINWLLLCFQKDHNIKPCLFVQFPLILGLTLVLYLHGY